MMALKAINVFLLGGLLYSNMSRGLYYSYIAI